MTDPNTLTLDAYDKAVRKIHDKGKSIKQFGLLPRQSHPGALPYSAGYRTIRSARAGKEVKITVKYKVRPLFRPD